MNLTDLTEELRAQAGQATPDAGMVRLIGVRHRIRVRRRRQMATAAAATAGCVAAIVLGPTVAGLRANSTNRTPPAHDTSPGPSSSPLVFDPMVAGDPLITSAVGAPGQQELVLRFTPADNNLAISDFCRLPDAGSIGASGLVTSLTMNGKSFSDGGCNEDSAANQSTMSRGDVGAVNRAGWADFGVIPGRESVVRLRVTAAEAAVEIPAGVRLGLGIYELSGPRVQEQSAVFQELYEADGHSYRLADHATSKVDPAVQVFQLMMDVPAGRYPVQAWLGLKQADAERKTHGNVEFYVDGKPGGVTYDAGGSGFVALPDAAAHTIEVRVDPGLRGTMMLAYYVRTG
jgi:hypothetical protein